MSSTNLPKGRNKATLFELRRELQEKRKIVLDYSEIRAGSLRQKQFYFDSDGHYFVNVDGEHHGFGEDDYGALFFYNRS